MLIALVVTLEVESILRPLAPRGTWFSRFIADASSQGTLYACTLPTAVLAAWGCGSFARRLALSLLTSAWLYLIWQIVMQFHGRRGNGIGELGLVLSYFVWMLASYFSWTLAGLLALRWKLGIAFECDCVEVAAGRLRWQFSLRDAFYWTLALGVTLGAGRVAFPPRNWELGWLDLRHALQMTTQCETILECAIILPLPLALVFRWKWLPAALLVSVSAVAISIPYYTWQGGETMLQEMQSLPHRATRFYFTAWPAQVLPLLIALRLAGCRIGGTSAVKGQVAMHRRGSLNQ
jgi:hypothetical protein